MKPADTLAAVDLGSNSFHLLVGRVVGSQIYPLDSHREVVRLGAGLGSDKRLDRSTQAKALVTLRRFRERLGGFRRGAVRAVGTNALRVARNAPTFLREAREALGFPIDIIAGREEARLIYVGVSHSLARAEGRRLVVDIGGGSTECIVGSGYEPQQLESLYMGCVSWSLRFFGKGIDKAAMKAAETAARQELQAVAEVFRPDQWQEAVFSSGTARSIERIATENGWVEHGLTRNAVESVRSLLLRVGAADPERIKGLRESRAPVLAGGLAIMLAAFEELGISEAAVSEGALRHGILYDLLGRFERRDMREATVSQFVRRYGVDATQGERVRELALALFDAMASQLTGADTEEKEDGDADDREADRRLLAWAARLAEVGLSIAHADYHKHSAYVLANADMPGFSRMEQARLARLVLAQRGKLAKVAEVLEDETERRLVFSLRLAICALRRRAKVDLPVLALTAASNRFTLALPQGWLAEHPMTSDAFGIEAGYWKAAGVDFTINAVRDERVAQSGRR